MCFSIERRSSLSFSAQLTLSYHFRSKLNEKGLVRTAELKNHVAKNVKSDKNSSVLSDCLIFEVKLNGHEFSLLIFVLVVDRVYLHNLTNTLPDVELHHNTFTKVIHRKPEKTMSFGHFVLTSPGIELYTRYPSNSNNWC